MPLRVAKYDVALEEGPLYAVLGTHTILSRMVHFTCDWCTERFAAFHPAYEPPPELGLELLKRGRSGTALCNIEVAKWNELPALEASESELVVAAECSGVCRRCHLDMEKQLSECEGAEDVLPLFSYIDVMDPVWKFPHQELAELFQSLSLTDSMLVALDHMSVTFVTVAKTRLTKFRKNPISFPQELSDSARRLDLLCG